MTQSVLVKLAAAGKNVTAEGVILVFLGISNLSYNNFSEQ